MKIFKKMVFVAGCLFMIPIGISAQARLTIENNSIRSMSVKIMKGYGGKGSLHEMVDIAAYSSETVYFYDSGYYFTKSKATLKGRDAIYRKGKPFSVTNDQSGYSVMTLTFSIKESTVPQVTGGKAISKAEFDEN